MGSPNKQYYINAMTTTTSISKPATGQVVAEGFKLGCPIKILGSSGNGVLNLEYEIYAK